MYKITKTYKINK